jgi:phosphoenolpyruvate carboxykinase (ATP)
MPRNTWSDPVAYDRQAHQLAELFKKNFAQFELTDNVVAAGPQ